LVTRAGLDVSEKRNILFVAGIGTADRPARILGNVLTTLFRLPWKYLTVNKAVLKAAAAVNKFKLFVTTTTKASETCMVRNGRDCGRNKLPAIVASLVAEVCKYVERIE
jgi:hypothetical protein